jgi:hypothetical protein
MTPRVQDHIICDLRPIMGDPIGDIAVCLFRTNYIADQKSLKTIACMNFKWMVDSHIQDLEFRCVSSDDKFDISFSDTNRIDNALYHMTRKSIHDKR